MGKKMENEMETVVFKGEVKILLVLQSCMILLYYE